jgi:8-oxo-dGTP pyrophosphatase MutT (NUDIX family)
MSFYYRHPNAPTPNRPPSLGVVALLTRDGALLLERRSDAGRWGLIGGAVDPEESLHAALLREVMEETGLDLQAYQLFGTFSDPSRIIHYPDGSIIRIITLAYTAVIDADSVPRLSAESLELRFFTPAELMQLDIVETHRHIIDRFLALPSVAPILD